MSSRRDGFDRDLEPRVRKIAFGNLETFGRNATRRETVEDGFGALPWRCRDFERATVASDLGGNVRMGFEPVGDGIEHALRIVVDGRLAPPEDDRRARFVGRRRKTCSSAEPRPQFRASSSRP